jgi:hypothetical protein
MNLSRLAGFSLLVWTLALPALADAPNDWSELPIAVAGTEFTLTADLSTATSAETGRGSTATAWSAHWRYVRDQQGREGDGWRAAGSTLDR